MGFARFAWMAVLACGAAAAYGVYAPDAADRLFPSAGGLAHELHNRIWTPPSVSVPVFAEAVQYRSPDRTYWS